MSYHPVGHRGVEPRHTRLLSDGPRRPAGSWQPEDGGVEPHGTLITRWLSRPARALARHLPKRIAKVLPPCPSQGPAGFEPAAAPRQLHDPVRMALESNQLRTRAPTARFQRSAFPVDQPSIS